VAARALVPYPPGVPLLWPGEEVTAEVLEVAEAYRHAGVELQGVTEGEREEPLLVVVEE
jgi:arginine/lysine/ornithine decarboxylase